MSALPYSRALIIGAGSGISASLARQLRSAGLEVALAARDTSKLDALCAETGARAFAADATQPDAVAGLFNAVEAAIGSPDVLVYNASTRVPGPITEVDPLAVQQSLMSSAFGGFLAAQQAARRMLPKGHGAILFTGASASVKGYPKSAAFAMGKFALRGLAQSLAREIGPAGIHVAHFVIDGAVSNPARQRPDSPPDSMLSPDAIAQTYLDVLRQPRTAWSLEVELRPWVEHF